MIEQILDLSVRHRWLVVLLTAVACALGVWSLTKLPIDAVPDITNNQVQINTVAPALSPVEVEKQVTFPIETALAGIPGLEYTRSLSRNGFSQVTAVFGDKTDIYFARQQVNERLQRGPGKRCRPAPRSRWADLDRPRRGLHVDGRIPEAGQRRRRSRDGQPGWQSDGSYLTPEGERLRERFRARGLSAHGAGLDHPPAAQERAGRRRRRRDRRLRQAVPRRSPIRRSCRATACRSATSSRRSRPTTSAAAPATSSTTARATSSAPPGASRTWTRSARSSSPRAAACRCASTTSPRSTIGRELRTGSASENGAGGRASAPR